MAARMVQRQVHVRIIGSTPLGSSPNPIATAAQTPESALLRRALRAASIPQVNGCWSIDARLLIHPRSREIDMPLTSAHILPIAALVAGILVLIFPRILNYIVAIYLIVYGLIKLNELHRFI